MTDYQRVDEDEDKLKDNDIKNIDNSEKNKTITFEASRSAQQNWATHLEQKPISHKVLQLKPKEWKMDSYFHCEFLEIKHISYIYPKYSNT